MHHQIKSPRQRRGFLSIVRDRHQAASLQPICLAPHRLLRRLCHFLALDDRWAKDTCHEFGLRYLLTQRNHFRHFLEELVPRGATLVSWLLHTHSTSYAFNGSAKGLQSADPPCGTFWAQTRHFLAFGAALRSLRWPGSPLRRPYRMSVAITR